MFDCTTDKYDRLYARWLVDPGKLLDLADLQPGERVIDLCGGSGVVAKDAVRRGAKTAFVVDLNPWREDVPHDYRMLPLFQGRAEEVDELLLWFVESLHDLADPDDGDRIGCRPTCHCKRYSLDFDLVVCRQAIGYLDIQQTARAVWRVLRPGGRFVFNTFRRPRFALRSYKFDGRRFFEASGYFGRTVLHVQAAPSIGVDLTKFKWHHERDLDAAFAPYFWLTKTSSDRSLYYICTRRDDS